MTWKYTIRVNLVAALTQALLDDRGEGGPTSFTQIEGLGSPKIIQHRPTRMPVSRLTAIRTLPYVENATEEEVP